MVKYCIDNKIDPGTTIKLMKAVNRVAKYLNETRKTVITYMELDGTENATDQIAETKKHKAMIDYSTSISKKSKF